MQANNNIPNYDNKKITLLYIDDEENNLNAFKATFRRQFDIDIVTSAHEAKKMLVQKEYEVIVSDQRMPEMTGVEFFQEIKITHPAPVRVLLTGYADITAVIDAVNKGEIYRYLQKPWNEIELSANIRAASELHRLRESNKALTNTLKKVNKQLEFLVRQSMIS